MTSRLVFVAHAATPATARAAFSLDEPVQPGQVVAPIPVRPGTCLTGPELRCRQTAQALGWTPSVEPGLADLDAGRWKGVELGEIVATEPDAAAAWLRDVDVRPHGGESLADVVQRVGSLMDSRHWPAGRSLLVCAPLVIRAALVHLLAAPASLLFTVDVGPLTAAVLTRHSGRWKLRALLPWGTWETTGGSRSPL